MRKFSILFLLGLLPVLLAQQPGLFTQPVLAKNKIPLEVSAILQPFAGGVILNTTAFIDANCSFPSSKRRPTVTVETGVSRGDLMNEVWPSLLNIYGCDWLH
ncbi:hypothetical protein EXU57_21350 [Segetibacter sp. 3557_3]|uniref:hypothetical protein n=1 Tax=Segetibacter sp. 3557_3 TaxID=2547429 RepID=UPI001058A9AC|nr:hypothetical protein [Segetibacter sp. 3557_3]TDH20664.1 hypothetical protein EXU57_21350 [Segetibacter sp. 3557_3]